MKRKLLHDNSHLTLNERKIIQTGIENRSTKVAIAKTIGKDPTTVAKEIRLHRQKNARNTYYRPSLCIHNKLCGGCKFKCAKYEEIKCKQRDRSPGACNKCPRINTCHLDHYFYKADSANANYQRNLVNSRAGINIDENEIKTLASIIVPLINQGQSIYQIKANHPEIKQCKQTIYNYIDIGIFRNEGLINLSLKEKVKRKLPKDKYKKRKEPINYLTRKYEDYLEFKNNNPIIKTVEMDTVMNSLSGPYIQTLIFEDTNFMIGFLHKEKTNISMSEAFDKLEGKLGHELFCLTFPLIITDRGVEFEKWDMFEANAITGEYRCKIFYCDPMASWQKPHVENNHNYIRDILPNEIDLSFLTQQDLDLMFSHINSTPREIYKGKTPYEMFEFLYGKDLTDKLNIKQIKRDEVILKPYLLTKKK